MITSEPAKPETDWESRALCPDEGCIGVLGADGQCPICGQRGDVPAKAERAAAPAEDEAELGESSSAAAAPNDAGDEAGDDSLADRELCPDESCIGVLDEHGACKVCGAKKSS